MPPERLRRLAGLLVAVAAIAVIAWGLLVDGSSTETDRVEALAERLRCPVCQSESIAASTSQTARALREVIAEQVADGRSDAEIESYFVGIWGEWVLLDPPARGRTLLLWLLPLAGAGIGVAAIVGLRVNSRRRAAVAASAPVPTAAPGLVAAAPDGDASDPRRVKLAERRALAAADLADLDVQLAVGEIDDATHADLARVYRAEVSAADSRLAALAAGPASPGLSPRRALLGAGAFTVAAVIVVAGVVLALEDRPEDGFVTGGITGAGAPRDLSTVTNEEMEAVVAANPDVVGMRMALARRYVDAGEFDKALDHLLTVLEQDPNAEAMAYVGWITYLGGETDLGVRYLERSLEVDADRPEALWFLALARLEALDDPAGAIPLLERLLENPDLQGGERDLVGGTLETAREAAS